MTSFFHTTRARINEQKGFTLFLAVLVSALLLAVGIAIFNISYKELILSSSESYSQSAFYAAQSGLECALYWDIRQDMFSSTTPPTNPQVQCEGVSPVVTFNGLVRTFTLDPNPAGIGDHSCAVVTVTKGAAGDLIATKIESRGYNTCDTSDQRRTERGIKATY